MAPVWKIIWTDGGGVGVRDGKAHSSKQLAEKLATGAEVEQVKLVGEELHFKKLSGNGPMTGWTTVEFGCKCGGPVCLPFMKFAECVAGMEEFTREFSLDVDFDAPAGCDLPKKGEICIPVPTDKEEEPVLTPPPWKKVVQPQIQFSEIKAAAQKKLPGDYYGMAFPSSRDELMEMGAEWLTRAFHASGALPKKNSVSAILDAKEFVGGGAGLKCTLKVEYMYDKPYLHKELFIKFPHKPEGSDRFYVSCMWNHDRPEIIFNTYLGAHIPYRIPKCYFADICAETTNFILITESLPWCKKGTKTFKPGDVEPVYDKFMDWEMPDAPTYYLALCKALGHIAGFHKAGKFPQIDDMFPMPAPIAAMPKNLPPVAGDELKMFNAKADQLIKFLSETAKAVFPLEITDKRWLSQWKDELKHFMDYRAEVHCFCSGAGTSSPSDFVGFTHQNLQVDNAFFWRNDSNEMQVGMLDWGVVGCTPLIGAIHGCITGAETDILLGHRDEFLRAFRDSYKDHGGPNLNLEKLRQMSNLQMMGWASNIISNVTQVLKFTKMAEWKEIQEWMDPRLVGRFQTRAHCTQFKIALELWQKWSLYDKFKAWLQQEGLSMDKSKVSASGPTEPLMKADPNHPSKARCEKEMAKQTSAWQMVGMDTLMANHEQEKPGMRYGLNFPHSPDLLQSSKYGAAWLTKAFHAAGTMPADNKVKKIVSVKPLTGGGACLKVSIEVEYEKPSKSLHTKLFMKYPFSMNDAKTRSDRMNSSINLQSADLCEIDAYRLLEASLPFPMPKFYFGDINNETTNFILITELINYAKEAKKEYKPHEIELAYDKFLDDEQFTDAHEYYTLLVRANATMAGTYIAGKLGDAARLEKFFPDTTGALAQPFNDSEFKAKLRMGEEFLRSAKNLFPPNTITEDNLKKWKRLMCVTNTYRSELGYLATTSKDYWAMCHGNFNVDNTWWWRDENKKLCVGALDWGGLMKVNLSQKFWWSLYAAEFHYLQKHLDDLVGSFIGTYQQAGGPALDRSVFLRDFFIAAVEQNLGLLGAIPQVYRVIAKKEWEAGTVKDRDDSRLRVNFLTRMYVMGMVLIFRMVLNWDLLNVFEGLVKLPGMPAKTIPAL